MKGGATPQARLMEAAVLAVVDCALDLLDVYDAFGFRA